MNFDWIKLDNPVALWWIFLVSASTVNILFWSWTKFYLYRFVKFRNFKFWELKPENLIFFSALYVFGCAYRSFFVKADVQRICVFDSWFSSVFLGRTVATFAELAFVAQWAIILRYISNHTNDKVIKNVSYLILPIIFVAEIFSWYAVISTNYLGNAIEESLWTISYSLILIALLNMRKYFRSVFKYAIDLAIFGDICYIIFMITVDVKMYVTRLISDHGVEKNYLGFYEGLVDLNTRWHVTYSINDWITEIPWMSLYFSFAVLVSITLCYVPLEYEKIKKYLKHH